MATKAGQRGSRTIFLAVMKLDRSMGALILRVHRAIFGRMGLWLQTYMANQFVLYFERKETPLRRYFSVTVLLTILLGFAGSASQAQNKSNDAQGHPWYQHAVFYEIYPRSFMDSNGDGIGDLNGIASKLDYLKALGVDAIWIAPCFPSPQVDFGYDVSDYENIDKMYGTLADFDKLQQLGESHGIKIILDLVVNHTSDQHPWFVDSRSSRTSDKRDWYIWRDGAGKNPPNNWIALFGGLAWQWDDKTGQYYYHFFYPQQPDLNWRNPAVANAIYGTTEWWYERGVAGFRLDAVDALFEDPNLTNDPILPGVNAYGDPNVENKYTKNLPELHGVLKNLRTVANKYDAVLIGETWTDSVAQLVAYYGAGHNELQMPMDLLLTRLKFSAPVFREHIDAVDASGEWPVFVIGNHDTPRSWNRYGDGTHNDEIAKDMAAMYLTLRGTPIMYYGEEIGMQNNDPKRREDVKDPIGKLGWPKEKGRDGERTPMQWNDDANAGFTTGIPWNVIPESYRNYNVADELKDPDSILNWYKKLLALRHTDAALLDGGYVALNERDANVLSYLRKSGDEAVLVVINMSAAPQKVNFDLSGQGLSAGSAKTLLTTQASLRTNHSVTSLTLQPFAAYIAKLGK
jgi:alpha-glucosidase